MRKPNKVIEVKKDEKSKPEAPISSSEAKKRFQALIVAYKKQNPVKYEQKKVALEAQLKKL